MHTYIITYFFIFKLPIFLIQSIVQTIVVAATKVLEEKEILTGMSITNVAHQKNSNVFTVGNVLYKNMILRHIIFMFTK